MIKTIHQRNRPSSSSCPFQAVRSVAVDISGYMPQDGIVVNVAKGLEVKSLKDYPRSLKKKSSLQNSCIIWTSHAEEVSRGYLLL